MARHTLIQHNSGVMARVLASSGDHGFECRLFQTEDYKIGTCCFCARHAALKRKSKEWNNMSIVVSVS